MRWLLCLLLLLVLFPSAASLKIEVEVGEKLRFTIPDLPENSTVTWYTESGESVPGEVMTRSRTLEGLRRVTAVVESPRGVETATFRYYTTRGDWRVYSVDQRNFSSLMEVGLEGGAVEVSQKEGRGGVALISASPSRIMLSASPPPASSRYLIFFHITDEAMRELAVTGVRWNSSSMEKMEIGEVLTGPSPGYAFREEEGYLVVDLSGPGTLEIDLGGADSQRHIPGGERDNGGGGGVVLPLLIILGVAAGLLLSRFLISTGKGTGRK